MYNRYIAECGGGGSPNRSAPPQPPRQPPQQKNFLKDLLGGFNLFNQQPSSGQSPQQRGFLKDLFGGLKLKLPDRGDLLLMLVLLILCMEDGDEWDSLIVIGLVFLLGI